MMDIVYSIALPSVCLLGIVGCSLSLAVFAVRLRAAQLRNQSKKSLDILLLALSACDLLLLTSSLILLPSVSTCQTYQIRFICALPLFAYPLSMIAQVASVWSRVLIAVNRFIAVRYPMQLTQWQNTKKICICLACVCVGSVLYRLPTLFELTYDVETGILGSSRLFENFDYYLVYHLYCYMLVLFPLPCLLILALNVIILRDMRLAARRRRQMTRTPSPSNSRHSAKVSVIDVNSSKHTITASATVLTFLLLYLPAGVVQILPLFVSNEKLRTAQWLANSSIVNKYVPSKSKEEKHAHL